MPSSRRSLLVAASATACLAAWPAVAQAPTPQPLPGERVLGRADAPVTVIEFHSLTCGNCARFHTEILPRIKAEFIDPGLVRMVLRDFPLDRVALEAATMVHCAGPEKFEPLLSLLYTQKEAWAHSQDARAYLRRVGMLAGLPAERLDACWSDRAFWEPIAKSRLDAEQQHGINATPSFIINGVVHRGVLSFERFSELVRPLLPAGSRG